MFLRPLPYPEPDRLVVLNEHQQTSANYLNVHPGNFAAWRDRARSFEALTIVQAPPLNVMVGDDVGQVGRFIVTPEVFRVFAVAPSLARAGMTALPRHGLHLLAATNSISI